MIKMKIIKKVLLRHCPSDTFVLHINHDHAWNDPPSPLLDTIHVGWQSEVDQLTLPPLLLPEIDTDSHHNQANISL